MLIVIPKGRAAAAIDDDCVDCCCCCDLLGTTESDVVLAVIAVDVPAPPFVEDKRWVALLFPLLSMLPLSMLLFAMLFREM